MRTLVLLFSLALSARASAVIEGKVDISPAARAAAAPNARYQNNVNPDPADPATAVVYLEGNFPAPTEKETVRLEQRRFQFRPALLPVRAGTTVEFPNLDDDYHNVFSLSRPKRFDLGKYRKDEKPASQVFEKLGAVRLFCEIHEHMRATILVLDTPHFARTDKEGKYRLENIPPGSYKLKAWLDEKMIWEKPVEVADGKSLTVDFTGE
jgi:plastocyanin